MYKHNLSGSRSPARVLRLGFLLSVVLLSSSCENAIEVENPGNGEYLGEIGGNMSLYRFKDNEAGVVCYAIGIAGGPRSLSCIQLKQPEPAKPERVDLFYRQDI